MKNFFRKVAFGIGPNEQSPSDPLKWALDQVNDVPELSWKGKIYSEKELRKYYRDWVYGDRKVLRKKYKDNKTLYKTHKDILRHKTGQKFWESLEISIRHNEGINSSSPVLAKLWMFWGNFFAISEKDFLANYSTGAYQREIIRPNLNQSFEKMVYDVTTSWAMIHHLDNSESAGPKSVTAGEEWRIRKKEPATINENHARELLELHTVSPKAGYSQEDVIQLAYIMTGWQHRWSKKNLETGNVWFNSEYHQRGKKNVLGKEYKKGKKALAVVVKDLVNHPNCRDFVAERLCKFLITDEPTQEMKQPIIDAFKKSDGFIPEIHKAAIKVAFEYNDKYKKFQTPENWLIQVAKVADLNWPPSPDLMDKYELGQRPFDSQREPEWLLQNIGHHPYRAKQPNGWSDHSADWISPELLIRRLVYAKASYNFAKMENNKNSEYYVKMVENNFDNPSKIMKYLNQKNRSVEKHTLLFNHPEFLKA
ncbi:DUF1800 family protein [Candidatus Pelagibacter sp.]|uniref:DUF1800 family protein n=1 Tax=Candidatus Pelagibacter sp. TaxID=2024849 RepID=UPI003F85CCD3